MRYTTKRTYPAAYHKKNPMPEKSIDFSLAAAAGILVCTFAAGFFWGFVTKKCLDNR